MITHLPPALFVNRRHEVGPRPSLLALLALLMLAPPRAAHGQADAIDITKTGLTKAIPIAIAGLSGEVNDVLRFDLEVMGFRITDAASAQYVLNGSNNGGLQATVTDRISKAVVHNARYEGGSQRAQAHKLANELSEKIARQPGIAFTRIAFKIDTGRNSEIYVSDYDGFNPVALTRDNSIVAAPAWVPGQRKLYYTSYLKNNPDIYSHDLTDGNRQIVARYSGLNTSATVSPDGRRVAMILSKGGSPDLWVGDADGSNLRQLTQTREDESSPCWSPDGRSLCFASRANGRPQLFVVPASGGTMQRIRTDGVLNCTEPDWSPDGRTIVFTAQMGGFQICTVPAAGGEATVLVGGEDPSWAPNSRTVIFTRRNGGSRSLSLLDVPTKRVKDIRRISGAGNCSQPAWEKAFSNGAR